MIQIIQFGFIGFLIFLLIHSFVWNIFRISAEIKCLFGLIIFHLFIFNSLMIFVCGFEFDNFIMTNILLSSLLLAYIQTYPALREDIPSVKILMLVNQHQGINFKELIDNKKLNKDLKGSKENDLLNDGFIIDKKTHFELTKIGKFIAQIFKFYRKLINIQCKTG
jgi:hypothetical protein